MFFLLQICIGLLVIHQFLVYPTQVVLHYMLKRIMCRSTTIRTHSVIWAEAKNTLDKTGQMHIM